MDRVELFVYASKLFWCITATHSFAEGLRAVRILEVNVAILVAECQHVDPMNLAMCIVLTWDMLAEST